MRIASVLITALLLASFGAGCGRDEGPAERAGQKIDEAVDEITHPGEGPLEEAGRKADETVERTKKQLED